MKAKMGLLIHPEELDDMCVEVLPSLGVSVLGIHPVGGSQAHLSLARLLKQVKDPDFHKRVATLEAKGISVEFACHALTYLLPRDLFQKNPEWFRMSPEGNRLAESNCCASNTEAFETISAACAKLAADLPTRDHRYHLWLDDIFNGGCWCEPCRQMSHSDQALTIVHAMLAGLKRTDPEAKLSFLAYHDTMETPNIKPHPDVYLEYAPMARDHHVPINAPHCEKNAGQFRPLASLLRTFGCKDATALDYWMDNSMFSGWKKPPRKLVPDLQVAAADVDVYRQMGMEYITTFACYLGEDYRELWGDPPVRDFIAAISQPLS